CLSSRPVLERLEERIVASIAEGDLIVPTQPSPSVQPPLSDAPRGLIDVNPNDGTQTPLVWNYMGGTFTTPQCVVEAPSRITFIPAPPQLYVADSSGGPSNRGAIIEYDPWASPPTTRVLANAGIGAGFVNQPVCLAWQRGYLYFANCGDRTITRLDPFN